MTSPRSVVAAELHRCDPGEQATDPAGDRTDVLGDQVVNRLFRVGLDLCSALGLARDEQVRLRLRQSVEELDVAIKDLRLLLLTTRESRS